VVDRTKDIRSNVCNRQIISGKACSGQIGGVVIASNDAGEKTYIVTADLWRGDGSLKYYSKNVQLLNFNTDGIVQNLNYDFSKEFNFTIFKGAGTANTGKTFTDRSDPIQKYNYTCDLYKSNFYQT